MPSWEEYKKDSSFAFLSPSNIKILQKSIKTYNGEEIDLVYRIAYPHNIKQHVSDYNNNNKIPAVVTFVQTASDLSLLQGIIFQNDDNEKKPDLFITNMLSMEHNNKYEEVMGKRRNNLINYLNNNNNIYMVTSTTFSAEQLHSQNDHLLSSILFPLKIISHGVGMHPPLFLYTFLSL